MLAGCGQWTNIMKIWAPYSCAKLQQGKGGWKSNKDIICSKTWSKNLFISNTAFLLRKMLKQEREQGRERRAGPGPERRNLNFRAVTCDFPPSDELGKFLSLSDSQCTSLSSGAYRNLPHSATVRNRKQGRECLKYIKCPVNSGKDAILLTRIQKQFPTFLFQFCLLIYNSILLI